MQDILKKLFSQVEVSIHAQDFVNITKVEFENPVIKQGIDVYNKFYDDVKNYIGKIK